MATSKKTATKAVSKKTPTKKAAPAAAKKPVYRTDYKPGARVKCQRRTGEEAKGSVVEVFTKKTGAFIRVNIGTKQVPIIKDFRPAAVRGF